MSDQEQMKVFADQLWQYFEPKLQRAQSSSVSYFRAEVVSNPGGRRLEVRRPFDDTTILARCTENMSSATVGSQVTVLVFGSLSNAVVVSDGEVRSLGGGGGGGGGLPYVFSFTSTSWTNQTVSVSASTHGCGSSPTVDVQVKNGSNYEFYYGFPSNGWTVTVDANGNISLTVPAAGMEFDGRLIVR